MPRMAAALLLCWGMLATAFGAPAQKVNGRLAVPIDSSRDDASPLESDFSITEGNQVNWFIASGDASSHIVVTNEKNPRILIVCPEGNVGIGLWFDRKLNKGLNMRLTAPPRIAASPGGVDVDLVVAANRPQVLLTEYALDSVRVLRSQHSGEGGLLDPRGARALRRKFAETHTVPPAWVEEKCVVDVQPKSHDVVIDRATLDGKSFHVSVDWPLTAQIAKTPRGVDVTNADERALSFRLHAHFPIQPMHRYTPNALLRPGVLDVLQGLEAKAGTDDASPISVADRDGYVRALRALFFLSRREKFMAGSWRFLTYFGRDTMISLMMLADVVTPDAFSDGIQSVLDRLAADGDVAHEEDLGTFAELRHAQDAKLPGNPQSPVYDYKMVDDDVLLPIMEGMYLTDARIPSSDRRAFLLRSGADGRTNLDKVLTNWNFVLGRAERWAANHGRSFEDLIRVRKGLPYGNWRDSEAGLAHGVYPEDVNVDLVPQALLAMDEVSQCGIIEPADLKAASARLPHLASLAEVHTLERAWDVVANKFTISMDAPIVRKRLTDFIDGPLDVPQRNCLLASRFSDGSTLGDFLNGGEPPPELTAPLRFRALSLDDSGHAVPVMNSDFGFRLFLTDVPPDELSELLRLLELPYPVGLMTPVGPVVANAAYYDSSSIWKELSRDSYHGAVIWSWQASMLELGLLRQLTRLKHDPSQAPLVRRLQHTIRRMIDARRAVGPLAGSELWTWDVKDGHIRAIAFGQRAGSDTESNAVQLWSTIFPALYLKEQSVDLWH